MLNFILNPFLFILLNDSATFRVIDFRINIVVHLLLRLMKLNLLQDMINLVYLSLAIDFARFFVELVVDAFPIHDHN